ncbi:MAG: 4'-phosphopantetheinyl transferase superfamily protein, partial [bacterium]
RFPQLKPREVRCRVQEIADESGERILEAEVFVVLRRPDTGQPQETLSARATLKFGQAVAAPKPALVAARAGTGDYRISAKPLFETSLYSYRQGVFQNVLSIGSILRRSSEGEVLSPPLRVFGSSPMLRNPLLLDGMASFMEPQLSLFFERLYPFLGGFESLEFFGDADPSDVRYVRCVLQNIDEKDAFFTVEAVDSLGRVAEKFHGLRKVFARVIGSEEFIEPVWSSLRENPRQKAIRDLLGCQGGMGIASVDLRMVESSYEVDPDNTLDHLGRRERSLLESLRNPKRRLEFLAGRIAGKAAIQLLDLPQSPDLAEIQILKGRNGQPRVELESVKEVPRLSITHNQEVAVAVASTIDYLGVDVEDIKLSIADIRDEFCKERETKIVGNCVDASVYKILTHLWVIKEAVRKVGGVDRLAMSDVEVVEAQSRGEYLLAKITTPDRTPYISASYFSGKQAFAFARGQSG